MKYKLFYTLVALILNVNLWCQDCDENWEADIILNSAVDDVTPTEYTGLNVYIKAGFKVSTHLILDNCDVRVDENVSFRFDEGAIVEIYGSTFKGCTGSWIGIRSSNVSFTAPVQAEFIIQNSFFYDFGELMHVNLKDESKFVFTDNYVVLDEEFFHILHFVNHGSLEDFRFYGNTMEAPTPCIVVQSELGIEWRIGDNNENPNIFISGFDSPTAPYIGKTAVQVYTNTKAMFENCVFSGVYTGVEARSGDLTFDNCLFEDCDYGFNSAPFGSNTQGGFESCTFENNEIGINVSTVRMSVENSFFTGNDTGIKVSLANQSDGSLNVTGSTFTNNIDIHCTGAFFLPVRIENNVFKGEDFGVLTDGESYYRLANNDFIDSYISTFAWDNGNEDNALIENSIEGLIGIHSLGVNNNLKFFDNCFNTQSEDANLNGTVAHFMGQLVEGALVGAGNCFTNNETIDINHSGDSFDYALPQEEYNTCHEPIYETDYSLVAAENINLKNCGSGYAPVSDEPICYISWDPTCGEVNSALDYLQGEIDDITNSTVISPYLKSVILARLGECKRLLRIFKMRLCGGIIATPDVPTDPDFEIRAKGLGYLISIGEYTDALAYLDTINASGEEALDYVEVQEINIRRLVERDTFVLDSLEEEFLREAGEKSYPLAAYARGLLTILTGEIIYPTEDLVEPRSSKRIAQKYFEINPNPANQNIWIKCESCPEEPYSVTFTNPQGFIQLQYRLKGQELIDISSWSPSMYFVTIHNVDGEIVSTSKLIKL